ncbi:MAG: MarC family protein [Laribacter sp.]|nr:MarC family protein [Laribacter sp.]MBP9528221.1 MarC family protein [Laribacter sp.]
MADTLIFFASKVLFVIAALFPILNPPGHAPLFLSLTVHNTPEERAILARKVGIYSFMLLLPSMFIGSYVLRIFDITLPFVQVGGGILVTIAAWEMLADKHGPSPEEQAEPHQLDQNALSQRAFYPITFPITVGPGSITVAITVGASMQGKGLESFTLLPLASFVAVSLIAYSLYWSYCYADRLLRLLGPNGTMVFLRLSAFILMCLGVQIFWEGLTQLILQFTSAHFDIVVRMK